MSTQNLKHPSLRRYNMQQAPIPTRRRRRCQSFSPTTTTLTLALLLTVASFDVLPSSQNYYFTVRASSPASLHKKTRRLGSAAANKNSGSSNSQNLERVVVVQPSNLRQAMSDEDRAKFLYEVAKFGQTQEGGVGNTKKAVPSEAMQASYSDGGAEVDTSIASYKEWVAMQKALKMGSTRSSGGSSTRINMDAHGYYMPQQHLGSTEEKVVDSTTGGEGAPAMQQIIPEKQVILRPMSQLDDPSSSASSSSSPKKTLSVPALLGSTQNGEQEPEVYYYDAGGITGTAYRNTPELTLPDEVFTASGQKLKLSDIHDGGKAEVFLEMNPKEVLGQSLNELNSVPKSMTTGGATSSFLSSSSSVSNTAGSAAQQSQDQMIVFLTVATMAIMVGMLSARRLRSRKFLEQCMTPDLDDDLDDVVRYDKKFDVSEVGSNSNRYTAAAGAAAYAYNTSGGSTLVGSPGRHSEYEGSETSLPHFSDLYPTQSSSIMGSLSRRSGYGTNDSVGGMHWRGDMEKFDV
mmetsp:Transcript_1466/g.2480  ORF Transcript_1466/g.2480 Transcript_1466/m.2480 type:complete len:517 (-) Transcript_1466:194-1744(-)